MLFKRIIYLSKLPLKLNKFKNASTAPVPEEAIQQSKYKCPFTGFIIDTISKHLYDGRCCGNGCRHCAYQLEGCNEEVKSSLVWNGAYYV
uniref:Uncharacterized protein n=1 Tax=Meloidogyne enterolobii TaxID=390850 RepID=A0A6V7UW20_MELEN|nr:unnamed protein product [Meloidogyne enterolobii]